MGEKAIKDSLKRTQIRLLASGHLIVIQNINLKRVSFELLLFLEVQSRCIERLMRSVRLLGWLGPALLGSALPGSAPFPGYLLVLSRRAHCPVFTTPFKLLYASVVMPHGEFIKCLMGGLKKW